MDGERRAPGLGCLVMRTLVGIFCVVRGIYLLFFAGALSAGQTLGALLLGFFGLALLVPVALWLAFVLWMRKLKRDFRTNMENLVRGAAGQGQPGGSAPAGPTGASGHAPIEVHAEVKDEPADERGKDKTLGNGES